MLSNHTHKFSIADQDAVFELLKHVSAPKGSQAVDKQRLLAALAAAVRRYEAARPETSRAFFHGLLTGYAVGLKHR
jgi:hypothetical protein